MTRRNSYGGPSELRNMANAGVTVERVRLEPTHPFAMSPDDRR